jgi:hypothetical protein
MTTGHGAFFEQYELEPPTNILQNPKRCKPIYSERKKNHIAKRATMMSTSGSHFPFPCASEQRERERGQELSLNHFGS